MFCGKCGAEVDSNTRYCSNCGFNLATQVQKSDAKNSDIPVLTMRAEARIGNSSRPKWGRAIVYSLVAVAVFGSWLAMILDYKAEIRIPPQAGIGIVVGPGILAALSAKKRNRSGMLWFFIAVVIGLVALAVIGVIRGVLRAALT